MLLHYWLYDIHILSARENLKDIVNLWKLLKSTKGDMKVHTKESMKSVKDIYYTPQLKHIIY